MITMQVPVWIPTKTKGLVGLDYAETRFEIPVDDHRIHLLDSKGKRMMSFERTTLAAVVSAAQETQTE